MTHDPLCEWAECVCPLDYDVPERGHLVHCPDQYCECEFIAKVRADERNRALSRIQSLPDADLMARTMYRADIVHALVCPVAGCLDKIEHTIWATPKPT